MKLHMIFRGLVIQPINFLKWQIGNKLPQDVLNPAHVSHITVNSRSYVNLFQVQGCDEPTWKC